MSSMVIFSGAGILALVFWGIGFAVAGLSGEFLDHQLAALIGFAAYAAMAAANWFLGRWLNRADPEAHRFFWIPMEFWSAIIAVFAVVSAYRFLSSL